MYKLFILFVLILILSCKDLENKLVNIPTTYLPERKEDYTLWQLEAFGQYIQMGYVIRTDDNKIIIVDGGSKNAIPHLTNFIFQLGGTVDYWIITHAHTDHVDTFKEILRNNKIEITNILHSQLDANWVHKNEPFFYHDYLIYLKYINNFKGNVMDLKIGDKVELGNGVTMSVLGAKNEEIISNAINNSSLVFKIESKSKSVLFLGDLGPEGGDKLLNNNDSSHLRSDYVQMAHHGSNGVNKNVYETINPETALWPTPIWLWENNENNKGVNSGPWTTLEVRGWMQEIGVIHNYVSGVHGTVQID